MNRFRMAGLPTTMRSLVAPKKGTPLEYIVTDMPVPEITAPDQVIVRTHSSTIETGEVMLNNGQLSMFHKAQCVSALPPLSPPNLQADV